MMARASPEQMAAGMGAWRAWHERSSGAIADLGAPLDHSTMIGAAGGAPAPTKTSITGYTLLKVESMEIAASLMRDHPHFQAPGASIQILEAIPIPGM
jgi:hypothetical protein